MDGLRAAAVGDVQDQVPAQIGFRRRSRAQPVGLVGQLDEAGVGVGVGMDGDGGDAERARGLDHAAGDFTAVGDEYLIEHGGLPR